MSQLRPGTNVMIFKKILAKKLAKLFAFFAQTAASFCKNLTIALVFEKNANCFAENWQKSQKVVIISSTPLFTDKTHPCAILL
jgi:hypothetical protein